MKTTKTDFERFKAEFLQYRERLGLTDFRCVFLHTRLEGSYGDILVDHPGKVVMVRFGTELPDGVQDRNPRDTARHEVLELLLARLENLSRCRYLFPDDITEERHAVIRRLENFLDKEGC